MCAGSEWGQAVVSGQRIKQFLIISDYTDAPFSYQSRKKTNNQRQKHNHLLSYSNCKQAYEPTDHSGWDRTAIDCTVYIVFVVYVIFSARLFCDFTLCGHMHSWNEICRSTRQKSSCLLANINWDLWLLRWYLNLHMCDILCLKGNMGIMIYCLSSNKGWTNYKTKIRNTTRYVTLFTFIAHLYKNGVNPPKQNVQYTV